MNPMHSTPARLFVATSTDERAGVAVISVVASDGVPSRHWEQIEHGRVPTAKAIEFALEVARKQGFRALQIRSSERVGPLPASVAAEFESVEFKKVKGKKNQAKRVALKRLRELVPRKPEEKPSLAELASHIPIDNGYDCLDVNLRRSDALALFAYLARQNRTPSDELSAADKAALLRVEGELDTRLRAALNPHADEHPEDELIPF